MTSSAKSTGLSVFTSDHDWWSFNACLGYHADPAGAYIDGYKEAADRLVGSLVSDIGRLDALIYPIAYLYRHYIELSLKQICRKGSILLERSIVAKSNHDLKGLWERAREVIDEVTCDEDKHHVARAEEIISEFVQLDAGSTAFRYAKQRDGKLSIAATKHINVRVLYEAMQSLGMVLDGVLMTLECSIDNKYG